MKTQTNCLATLLAVLSGARVLTAASAPRRLRVLVRMNDVAPGQPNGCLTTSRSFGFDLVNLNATGSPGRDYILQSSTHLLHGLSLQTNNASFDGHLSPRASRSQ